MKHRALALTLLASLTGFAAGAAHADKLDDIKQAGVVRIAVFDSNPPFGYIDPQSKKLVGYDVDVADAIGKALGVKVELRATNPANRIPLLVSKKVDLIAANFTITDERAKEVNFSVPYFATGQKFIARKGVLKTPEDIKKLRIGADKGTVQEITLRERFPTAKVSPTMIPRWRSWRCVTATCRRSLRTTPSWSACSATCRRRKRRSLKFRRSA